MDEQEKVEFMRSTLGEKVGLNPITTEFLAVVADNGRANELGSFFATFLKTYSATSASATGIIKTAKPLTEWQRASLERRLLKMFYPDGSVEELNVEYELDESLLGGITASIEDRFVDMSLRREVVGVEEIVRAN